MNDVTNIQAKRNAQWLEGAEHGRKAERERILAVLRRDCAEYEDATQDPDARAIDEQMASASRRLLKLIEAEGE